MNFFFYNHNYFRNPLVEIDSNNAPTAKKAKKERPKKDEKGPTVVITQKQRADHAKDELTVSKEVHFCMPINVF